MTSTTLEMRELTLDEIDAVSGGRQSAYVAGGYIGEYAAVAGGIAAGAAFALGAPLLGAGFAVFAIGGGFVRLYGQLRAF